jgi:flagellar basal body-associated protein FliL
MKLKIRRNYKYVLIGFLVVIIAALSYGIFFLLQNPETKQEKVVLYRCNHQSDVSYSVILKPNNLYDTPSLGEGQIYLAPLVDNIKAVFKYQFKGERAAALKGDYEIVGVLEGSQGEKDTYKTLWTKRYVLLPKTSFTASNSIFSLAKPITIPFNSYRTFADNLAKDLNISFNSKLKVTMNIHIQAGTDRGPLEESLSPGLVIPLNNSFFEISKLQSGQKDGQKNGEIQRTVTTKASVNKVMILGFIVALVIAVGALLYIVFFTTGIAFKDSAEKELTEIFKKHGSRMIALKAGTSAISEESHEVQFIDDLVKLSDETGRPIIYEYKEDAKDITRFYVVDQGCCYSWAPKRDIDILRNRSPVAGGVKLDQS